MWFCRAIRRHNDGKDILPSSAGFTKTDEDRLKSLVQEINSLDQLAPESRRQYIRRNPPVQRSLTG